MHWEEHVRTQRGSQVTPDLWTLRMKFAPFGAQNLEVVPWIYSSDMSGRAADIERNSDDDYDDEDDDNNDNTITYVFRKFSTFNSPTSQLVFPVFVLLHFRNFQIIHYTDGGDVKFHTYVF